MEEFSFYHMDYFGDFFQEDENKHFDIFISSVSLEERSSRGLDLLYEFGINSDKNIIFYFDELFNSISKNDQDKIHERFRMGQKNTEIFRSPILDPSEGIKLFYKYCFDKKINLNGLSILVDITTFVKPYFFLLLKYLKEFNNCKNIHILYTEPRSYYKKEAAFTKGFGNIGDIPGFGGISYIQKQMLLIMLLGFEGKRAYEVQKSIQPDKIVPVIGFPAFMPEYKDYSIIQNEETLRDSKSYNRIRYAPANNPFETANLISEICKESIENNICIAPLATKPMALGACLFALKHPEVKVVYPFPLTYTLKPSEGYEKTWIYSVEL